MGANSLHVAAPAVATAIGIYFFERTHSNTKELPGGMRTSMANMLAKLREEVKSNRAPKLAPQFDGLHCFETLVD
ncbi:hypothetical protein RHMOL_Rhmol03G0237500 [Rhododendron molle]|uniref:Uncharacterized protein n=1 Tax=Rhododendron molle TaxID=49168 RepID=A0ACC0PJ12_RHOML|nr:hypothetical protein RHMOL_Rhmol03G0237500 [Rhododendron molle]